MTLSVRNKFYWQRIRGGAGRCYPALPAAGVAPEGQFGCRPFSGIRYGACAASSALVQGLRANQWPRAPRGSLRCCPPPQTFHFSMARPRASSKLAPHQTLNARQERPSAVATHGATMHQTRLRGPIDRRVPCGAPLRLASSAYGLLIVRTNQLDQAWHITTAALHRSSQCYQSGALV